MQLSRMFHSRALVPAEHRSNFLHLYFDIAWFGVLNGSFIAFSAVYLTRVGATARQLSLFGALPALVALVAALPAGYWLKNRRLDKTVFWSAALYRVYYLAWLPIITLIPAAFQTNSVLLLTFIMSGPATILAIGFNSLFAELVPPEWRNHVIGIRHALLAIASILSALLCGYILDNTAFLTGYQIVFGLAAFCGVMSSVHLWFIRLPEAPNRRIKHAPYLKEPGQPDAFPASGQARPPFGWRYLRRRRQLRLPRLSILRGDFGRAMAVLGFFFVALYVPNALYYPYWVGELGYSDQLISFGQALFYVCQFLSASQLARIATWLGDRRSLALGAVLLAAYPGFTAIWPAPAGYLLSSAFSGIGWGIAGGAILTYLLRLVPADERPRYMSWYSLLTNLAILIGSLLGPLFGDWLGLRLGLGTAGIVRFLAGLIILWFGANVGVDTADDDDEGADDELSGEFAA